MVTTRSFRSRLRVISGVLHVGLKFKRVYSQFICILQHNNYPDFVVNIPSTRSYQVRLDA